jgi:PBSX family phage terminase large subunit
MVLITKHKYEPRGGCKEVFESKAEELLVSGPAGTGKSRACLEKLHMICLMTGGVRAAIVRKTSASLGSTALVTYRRHVAPEALANGTVVYYGGSKAEPAQYRYRNGSSITIGGMDNPMKIMSSEYDIIYVQEATELTIDDIEALSTRLRNWKISFQQLLMDCNPQSDKHPLKLRCNEGRTKLIESRHEDNPVIFNADGTLTEKGKAYIDKLDRLTGVRYKRLRLGLWVSAEGVIYEEFDPAYHVLQWQLDEEGNPLPLPDEWERYWVIDFGYVHPFVCKWYAIDNDGTIYMYREWYMTGRTVEDHAKQIMQLVTETKTIKWYDHLNRTDRTQEVTEWLEPKPRAIICDHDAEGRRTFEKHTGLGTQKAIKFVFDGIDLTKQRWQINESTGEARFYYMADALIERDPERANLLRPTCSVEEITSYAWKIGTDGKTKEEPTKLDDDGMDCDRYLVMHLDYKGKARVTLA